MLKKRFRFIWMVIMLVTAMVYILPGAAAQAGMPEPIAQTDFCIGFINLKDDFNKVKDCFDPQLVLEDRRIWANDGMYHSTWRNSIAEITVVELPAVFCVERVRVFTDAYCTPRGVKVGDTVEKIIATYGEPHWIINIGEEKRLLYNKAGKQNPFINNLVFVTDADSGEIKSISLYSAMAE